MTDERIYHFANQSLRGELDPQEAQELSAWMGEDAARKADFEALVAILEAADEGLALGVDPQTDAEWTALQARITAETPVIPLTPKGRSPWTWVASAAAVVLLAVAGYFLLIRGEANISYLAANGEVKALTLEDGSKVTLGPGSELRLADNFGGEERRVLLSGEAYFEVARDEKRPFVVEAGKTLTTVLGTRFNVRAIEEGMPVEVSVVSGKVMVTDDEATQKALLTADLGASFDPQSGKLAQMAVNGEEEAAWRKGELVLKNVPISSVLTRIERFYDIELDVPEAILDQSFTSTLYADDLGGFVEACSLVLNCKVEKDGKKLSLKLQ